jgi:hypothetical protein
MAKHYSAAFTMFVFLRGHHVLEYYFGVRDTRTAANDGAARHRDMPAAPARLKRRIDP